MADEVTIIESIYAIRPYLRDLIGDDAPAIEQQLDDLVRRARAGENTDNQIIDVLAQHPRTRDWIRRYLGWDEDETKSFQPLPGHSAPVTATSVFVCPQCGWRWKRREAGQPVPTCPIDGAKLEPVALPQQES